MGGTPQLELVRSPYFLSLLTDRVEATGEVSEGRAGLFTGFVRPDEARQLFACADLYVMTSVSEPFGLTTLEALREKTPVILSKGAGVGEVVQDVLAVDFWDVERLAGRMLAVLEYPALRRELAARGNAALGRWTWKDAGARIVQLCGSFSSPAN